MSAFTLIETMVSMMVVGVLVVSLYSGVTWGMGNYQRARETMRATEILTEKLDSVRLFTWEQITNGTSVPKKFQDYFDAEDHPNRGKSYAYAYAYGATNSNQGGNRNNAENNAGSSYGKTNKSTIVYVGTLSVSNGPADVTYKGELRHVTVSVTWTNSAGAVRSRSMSTLVSRNGLQNYIY